VVKQYRAKGGGNGGGGNYRVILYATMYMTQKRINQSINHQVVTGNCWQ